MNGRRLVVEGPTLPQRGEHPDGDRDDDRDEVAMITISKRDEQVRPELSGATGWPVIVWPEVSRGWRGRTRSSSAAATGR